MKQCEVCDVEYSGGCTNSRCRDCHYKYCGPGGIAGPGHGPTIPGRRPPKSRLGWATSEDETNPDSPRYERLQALLKKKEGN